MSLLTGCFSFSRRGFQRSSREICPGSRIQGSCRAGEAWWEDQDSGCHSGWKDPRGYCPGQPAPPRPAGFWSLPILPPPAAASHWTHQTEKHWGGFEICPGILFIAKQDRNFTSIWGFVFWIAGAPSWAWRAESCHLGWAWKDTSLAGLWRSWKIPLWRSSPSIPPPER